MGKLKNVIEWCAAIMITFAAAAMEMFIAAVGIYAISYGLLGDPISFLNAARIAGGIIILGPVLQRVFNK